MKPTLIFASLLFTLNIDSSAQKEGHTWIFGDHAGISFTDTAGPVSFYSGLNGNLARYNYATLSDNAGHLLLYAVGDTFLLHGVNIYNRFDSLVLNGGGVAGHPIYSQGLLLLPVPANDSLVSLFSVGDNDTINDCLNYSIINLHGDGGLGEVIVREVLLIPGYVNWRICAVHHANGRDWWILGQEFNTDEYYRFLLTPYGLDGPYYQAIPGFNNYHFFQGTMVFSSSGSRLASVGTTNAEIQLCDFDRCTGLLSNCQNIGEGVFSQENSYWGVAFSPSEQVLYVSNGWPDPAKYVYQYDLTATDIPGSKYTVNMYPDTGLLQWVSYGNLVLGPDGKIYAPKGHGNSVHSNTIYTHNIDVILNPDVVGAGCNYSTNYFNLGAGDVTYGLPNIPNFGLGALSGSICDSLGVGVEELKEDKTVQVYPQPAGDVLHVVSEEKIMRRIYVTDMRGRVSYETPANSRRVSLELNVLNPGIYILNIETDSGTMRKKFVKGE